MTTTSTPSDPVLYLALQCTDPVAVIRFLTEALDLTVTARYDDGDTVLHAQLDRPGGRGGVMLGAHRPGARWSRPPGTAGAFLVSADVDAAWERVLDALPRTGGEVTDPLADTDHGSREFTVRDPEGNLWCVGDRLT